MAKCLHLGAGEDRKKGLLTELQLLAFGGLWGPTAMRL